MVGPWINARQRRSHRPLIQPLRVDHLVEEDPGTLFVTFKIKAYPAIRVDHTRFRRVSTLIIALANIHGVRKVDEHLMSRLQPYLLHVVDFMRNPASTSSVVETATLAIIASASGPPSIANRELAMLPDSV